MSFTKRGSAQAIDWSTVPQDSILRQKMLEAHAQPVQETATSSEAANKPKTGNSRASEY